MERTIEKTGRTVEEAISQALEELAVSEDFALIEVLDEGETGGLLGFGRRPAHVRVTVDENHLPAGRKRVKKEEKISEPSLTGRRRRRSREKVADQGDGFFRDDAVNRIYRKHFVGHRMHDGFESLSWRKTEFTH